MKLKFFNPTDNKPFIITIHKRGKMGFPTLGAKLMGLDTLSSIKIGLNEDKEDTAIYLFIEEGLNPDNFRIYKAGAYFYIKTDQFFRELGFKPGDKLVYSVARFEYEGKAGFKLIRK